MPMTGFTVFIEASRLIPLDISVDEALRVTVSAGVLVPSAEQVTDMFLRGLICHPNATTIQEAS